LYSTQDRYLGTSTSRTQRKHTAKTGNSRPPPQIKTPPQNRYESLLELEEEEQELNLEERSTSDHSSSTATANNVSTIINKGRE
jgi:hypothetical protein